MYTEEKIVLDVTSVNRKNSEPVCKGVGGLSHDPTPLICWKGRLSYKHRGAALDSIVSPPPKFICLRPSPNLMAFGGRPLGDKLI